MIHQKNKKGLTLGVGLIIIGVIGLLIGLNIIPENIKDYILRWESILIVLGLFLFFVSKKLVGGFFLVAVGSYFLIDDIYFMNEKFDIYYWPIMFIVLGGVLLFSNSGFLTKNKN